MTGTSGSDTEFIYDFVRSSEVSYLRGAMRGFAEEVVQTAAPGD